MAEDQIEIGEQELQTIRQAVLVEPFTKHPDPLFDSGNPVLIPEIKRSQVLRLRLPKGDEEYFVLADPITVRIAEKKLRDIENLREKTRIIQPTIMLRRIGPAELEQLEKEGYEEVSSGNLFHPRQEIERKIV